LRRGIDIRVALAAAARIEGGGRHGIGHVHHVRAIRLHGARVHAHGFAAQAQHARPAPVVARFQFAKQHGTVAPAVIDVQVGARPHHHGTGHGRPIIVETEAMPFLAQAQLARSQRQAGHQRIARVAPVGEHRHRARALGREEAHFMVRLLPVGTRIEHAPGNVPW
jgi:hypothetical protein